MFRRSRLPWCNWPPRAQVTVERARNLPNADWSLFGGKSDPYVKLGLGIRGDLPLCCQKTKVIDDNLNPVWDEKFSLDVHSLEVQQLVLEVGAVGCTDLRRYRTQGRVICSCCRDPSRELNEGRRNWRPRITRLNQNRWLR